VETYEINIFAFTVLRDFKQIEDTEETRLSRQQWSDIGETDRRNRLDLDLTFFHRVPATHFDMRTRPYSDAASDFSATNAIAKTLGEEHADYFDSVIESTWITLVLASSVPITLTFLPANFSGVC
jgi:hypothetical protein